MKTEPILSTAVDFAELSICVCCGAQSWKLHKYNKTTSYLECRCCHYYFQYKVGSSNRETQFETEQQKFYDVGSLFLSPNYSALDAEILARRLSTIQHYLKPESALVEVGPGTGNLIVALKKSGYLTHAVEHSPVLANRLMNELNIAATVGDFADQEFPKASFDAYCSFHVIEHVIDFRKHLRVAADAVKPGGYAFIATPNSCGWENRLPFSLSPNYDSSHFQLFSSDALIAVLRETGWEVVKVTTPAYSIAWLRIITKILRRIRGQDEDSTGGHYASSRNKTLSAGIVAFSKMTLPFRYIQELFGQGNELLVIARRIH